MIYDDDRATMAAPWPISAPSSPGEGSRFMLTIDKVHQRRVWDSGNFETPPASPIPPLLSLPPLVHVGSSVTCDCVTSITRGTGEWIKQIGSRRRVTRRAHAWIHACTHARTHTHVPYSSMDVVCIDAYDGGAFVWIHLAACIASRRAPVAPSIGLNFPSHNNFR